MAGLDLAAMMAADEDAAETLDRERAEAARAAEDAALEARRAEVAETIADAG
jgi:hypothetical protein